MSTQILHVIALLKQKKKKGPGAKPAYLQFQPESEKLLADWETKIWQRASWTLSRQNSSISKLQQLECSVIKSLFLSVFKRRGNIAHG